MFPFLPSRNLLHFSIVVYCAYCGEKKNKYTTLGTLGHISIPSVKLQTNLLPWFSALP